MSSMPVSTTMPPCASWYEHRVAVRHHVDAEHMAGIDDVHDLQRVLVYAPEAILAGDVDVAVVDDVQWQSGAFANGYLGHEVERLDVVDA